MAEIRIKVGAAVDASLRDAFRPLEDAARRSRKTINDEAEKSGKEQTAAAERWARQRARIVENSAILAGKIAAKQAAEEKRQQDNTIRALERAEREKTRAAERESSNRRRAAERQYAEEVRAAERAAAQEERIASRNAAAQQRAHDRAIRSVGRAALGGAATALGFGARVATSVARGAGLDFDVASHVARNTELEQRAVDLANSAYMPGTSGANGVRQNPADIIKEVRQTATATAFDPTKAMEGLQAFVGKTGDLETGRAVFKDLAVLSRATGTELQDMVSAAADVSTALGDTDNKGEKVAAVMRQIAGEGKLGAVEIKDLASQMAKIAANAPQFAGDVGENIALLGAFAQEARQRGGATSATMAATSVASMVNTLKTPARMNAFKAAGIDVIDQQTKLIRNPQEILIEALKKKGNDVAGFKTLFANVQGARAVEGFASIYRRTYSQTSGDDATKQAAAIAAVNDEFDRLKKASLSLSEQSDSFKNAMSTTQSQAQILNNKLGEMAETLSGVVLGALKEFGPDIKALGSVVADVAGGIRKIFGSAIGNTEVEQQKTQFSNETLAQNAESRARRQYEIATGRGGRTVGADFAQQGDEAEKNLAASLAEAERKQAEERKNLGIGGGKLLSPTVADFRKSAAGGDKDAQAFVKREDDVAAMRTALEDLRASNRAMSNAITAGTLKIVDASPPAPPPVDHAGRTPGVTPAH